MCQYKAHLSVRDMQPVVTQNVSGICSDKMDADCGAKMFSGILLISEINPTLISPDVFLQRFILWLTLPLPYYHALSLTLSLSLSRCLSAILLSSPPFLFYVKCCLMF